MTSELAQMSWRNASHHSVLRQNVKDFATDPRNNLSFRQYVYVLACHFQDDEEGSSGESRCDCVEVYQQDTGIIMSRITFHSMLTFTQLQLTGSEVNRKVLLLTDEGSVYREVHTQAGYRRLYGSQAEFNPYKLQEPLPLPLPYKVVQSQTPVEVWCGLNHSRGRQESGRFRKVLTHSAPPNTTFTCSVAMMLRRPRSSQAQGSLQRRQRRRGCRLRDEVL